MKSIIYVCVILFAASFASRCQTAGKEASAVKNTEALSVAPASVTGRNIAVIDLWFN